MRLDLLVRIILVVVFVRQEVVGYLLPRAYRNLHQSVGLANVVGRYRRQEILVRGVWNCPSVLVAVMLPGVDSTDNQSQ